MATDVTTVLKVWFFENESQLTNFVGQINIQTHWAEQLIKRLKVDRY